MPCKQVACEGTDELFSKLAENEGANGNVYVLFTGKEDPATGESWCPDCVKGKTVL